MYNYSVKENLKNLMTYDKNVDTVVGFWHDGRTIKRKVIVLDATQTVTASAWKDTGVMIPNADLVISVIGLRVHSAFPLAGSISGSSHVIVQALGANSEQTYYGYVVDYTEYATESTPMLTSGRAKTVSKNNFIADVDPSNIEVDEPAITKGVK